MLGIPSAQAQPPDLNNAAASLVEAEKAYAKLGNEKGFRAASLANFADDAAIFAPGVVNGKKFWEESKEDPVISWRPSFASISRSGELGYTTGPWESRKARSDANPEAFGDFVTVWRKDGTGKWRVAVDVGVSHAQPAATSDEVALNVPKTALDHPESVRANLEKTQREFSDGLKKDGANAIVDNASDEIRVYRRGLTPAVGKKAAKKFLAEEKGKTSRKPLGAGTSTANDLAYEYGDYETAGDGATERGIYFCIWQLNSDGDWKLVLDLQKKAPPPKT